eukprot:5307333-Prymnesium_polylepis.1
MSRADLPSDLRRSHVRVTLPDGMDGPEVVYALRHYSTTRLLEIDLATRAFCGYDLRQQTCGDKCRSEQALLDSTVDEMVGGATPLKPCIHFHGGAGEVLAFKNIGQSDEKHLVTASRDRLPAV